MSPFLNKLTMPVSLQELLKVPSISRNAVKCLGIEPKARIPNPMHKVTRDPSIMIQSVMNKGDGIDPYLCGNEMK